MVIAAHVGHAQPEPREPPPSPPTSLTEPPTPSPLSSQQAGIAPPHIVVSEQPRTETLRRKGTRAYAEVSVWGGATSGGGHYLEFRESFGLAVTNGDGATIRIGGVVQLFDHGTEDKQLGAGAEFELIARGSGTSQRSVRFALQTSGSIGPSLTAGLRVRNRAGFVGVDGIVSCPCGVPGAALLFGVGTDGVVGKITVGTTGALLLGVVGFWFAHRRDRGT